MERSLVVIWYRSIHFGPQAYPRGSYVITHVRLSVSPWSVFEYLRDRSKDYSNFGPRVYQMGSMVIALVR